tara:strand:+ start:449 stop:913 length:465 start_codon:yes stop_codon:yes gene_type:complete
VEGVEFEAYALEFQEEKMVVSAVMVAVARVEAKAAVDWVAVVRVAATDAEAKAAAGKEEVGRVAEETVAVARVEVVRAAAKVEVDRVEAATAEVDLGVGGLDLYVVPNRKCPHLSGKVRSLVQTPFQMYAPPSHRHTFQLKVHHQEPATAHSPS